jgi:hypothetical protein
MGRKRYMGFIFITYAGDHPPYHVHILTADGRNIGRFDLEQQRPMDDFEPTKRLKKALVGMGYMTEEAGN